MNLRLTKIENMTISEHYDEIAQCNRCGFCQVACPIFRSTGHEGGVARGRLALLRAIIEGRLEWNQEIEAPLYDCLLCGACTANCFPAIPTADLVVKARSQYLEKVGRKSIHRLLFDQLLPYPRRLHLAARAVALGKNTGITDLAHALGLLRIFGRDFVYANEIVERFPAQAFRDQVGTGVYQGQGQSLRIGYFVGCGVDIISQNAAHATLKLLKKIARTVDLLQNCCCGLPAWSYGDLKAAQKLAAKNLSILASDQFDLIVTDCSSCASFLKNYARLFPRTDQQHEKAEFVSARVKDMVQLIHSMKVYGSSSHPVVSVTYHHPCHAARGQQLIKEPAEILNRLAGVEYRELPEADWCCGGAGSYAFSHYELSQQVLNRKMENLKKTGADLLITSCPACIMQLSYGIRKHGLSAKVCHISELIV
jgi:glycolate oxidase iron-sulfur subunit